MWLSNHEFHWPTATNTATVAIIGFERGKIIFVNIVRTPAPSSLADSSREAGRDST